MAAWLWSALIAAQDLASRRGQNVSTAHLLAALYQSDPTVAAVCGRLGLREVALVAELVFVDERQGSVDAAIHRAHRLAVAMGMRRVVPMHLLHVLAVEPQSASNRILLRLDMAPESLGEAALDMLDAIAPSLQGDPPEFEAFELQYSGHPAYAPQRTLAPPARPARAPMTPQAVRAPVAAWTPPALRAPARPARAPEPPPPPPSRPSRASLALEYEREHARANALWLGDEVEARLQQAGRTAPVRPASTFADQVEARLRRGR